LKDNNAAGLKSKLNHEYEKTSLSQNFSRISLEEEIEWNRKAQAIAMWKLRNRKKLTHV
jgi:hypothetical protein